MHAEMKRNAISAGVLTQDVGSCFTGSMRRRKHVVKACSGIVFNNVLSSLLVVIVILIFSVFI